MSVYAAGIDIGGTNTKIGIVSDNGDVIEKSAIKTAAYPDVDIFARKAGEIIEELCSSIGGIKLQGIGIGAPNGSSISGCIEYAPNLPWKGRIELLKSFNNAIPAIPANLTNDANAAALGENLFGAGRDYSDFITVTLGTGVGGGIFSSSKLLEGKFGLAGEIGHINLIREGRLCGCGRRGCVETYCSAGGIVQTAAELINTSRGGKSILSSISRDQLDSKKIYEAALEGDKLAAEVFDFTAELLASFFADLTHIFSTQAFIVTGGAAKSGDFLFNPLEKYFKNELMDYYKDKNIKILKSFLPEQDAAIIGAASLVLFN